jgi:hypothetical protein
MINDDITQQIATDYARLLTSTTEGFDLTLAEAIDYDVLPEDVLEQLCEMFVEAYYPTGNALNRPDGSERKWSGTGNSGKNLLRRQQQIADIVVARERGDKRINPLGASRDKPVSARDNMSSLYARGEAQSAAARHGFKIKPTITNFGRGSSTVQGDGKLQAGWRNDSKVGNTILQKGSSQQRRGLLATDSIERNKTQMGVGNKNSLLSRFQNIFNKRKEQGVHGAAAQSSALKPLNRRVIASQAKLGDAAGQETIRRDINKTGLKDKLRAAGLGTKVRVRVDKGTGHYHVTDASGKTHVIESKV